ncbi:MAG: hypothetical protein WA635_07625 [Gallionella sp.]
MVSLVGAHGNDGFSSINTLNVKLKKITAVLCMEEDVTLATLRVAVGPLVACVVLLILKGVANV